MGQGRGAISAEFRLVFCHVCVNSRLFWSVQDKVERLEKFIAVSTTKREMGQTVVWCFRGGCLRPVAEAPFDVLPSMLFFVCIVSSTSGSLGVHDLVSLPQNTNDRALPRASIPSTTKSDTTRSLPRCKHVSTVTSKNCHNNATQ